MTGTLAPFNALLDLPQVPVPNAESGPLVGLRLAVKDIYDVTGYRTGCGNPQKLADALPAVKTGPATQSLLDAGARFVGKTQTDELAFSLMGQNAHYPYPINPAAPDRVTGGSSSGSAAAVAGGLADIAIGSDTGGSIRAPASFCGLIGLRTSHGRISLEGAMMLAPSFDTFGWFARDIDAYEKTARLLLGDDSHHSPLTRPLGLDWLDALVSGPAEARAYAAMRGIVEAALGPVASPAPLTAKSEDIYWCFRHLQAYEAWQVHGDWISSGDRKLGPGVADRFAYGASIEAATSQADTASRNAFRAELAALLGDDGFLVLPTVPGAAPLKDAPPTDLQGYRERALHLLCLSGLSGFPQITLPIGTVDGAPFGLSLLGPAGSDLALIGLGRRVLERAASARSKD